MQKQGVCRAADFGVMQVKVTGRLSSLLEGRML